MVAHTYHPRTWEAETRELHVQDQQGRHSKAIFSFQRETVVVARKIYYSLY